MKTPQQIVQEWTSTPEAAAALFRMRQLAFAVETRPLGTGPKQISVNQALSIWSTREHSFSPEDASSTGLRELLSELQHLPPDRMIQQIALKRGDETGVVFFDPVSDRAVGTVIGKQTKDQKRRVASDFRLATARTPEREQTKAIRAQKSVRQTA